MIYPSQQKQLEALKNLRDEDIDCSDIAPITHQMPYLDVVKPCTKERLHARIDSDVLAWFKSQGKGIKPILMLF